MYKRDFITAEIQKLNQILARILGLKLEGEIMEADDLLMDSLTDGFGITAEDLFSSTNSQFELLLTEKAFPAEKLEMLSQFLYTQFDPTANTPANHLFAEKLQLIYQILETKYHIINMINLDRQKAVLKYLNT